MIDTVALDPNRHVPGARQHPRFAGTLHAEWVKLWSVRSTRWSLALLFLLGAGMTSLICWTAADAIATGETGEAPASFPCHGRRRNDGRLGGKPGRPSAFVVSRLQPGYRGQAWG